MKSWKLILIIITVIIALVLMFVFAFQGVQNKAINLEEQITTAQSEIEIQQKRRADLIPNFVDCIKAYDEHEYNTLMAVIDARGTSSDAAVDEVANMINVVAEAYPELKSNTNYQQLMTELSITENLIAQTRANYNTWITQYKTYVHKFPNKSILDRLGYEAQEFEKLTFDTSEDAPTNLFD